MNALPPGAVYLVTDRRRLSPDARTRRDELNALDALIDTAVQAGVDAIQVRERDLDAGVLAAVVRGAVTRAHGTSTRVLVNDRADVALAAGAHGVHLPARGLPGEAVKSLHPGWIVGRSLHAGDAIPGPDAADYLLFGTIYPSASKAAGAPAAGVESLRAVAASAAVPVLAIGGIDAEGAEACAEAGAAGVAGIGIFLPEGRHPLGLGAARAVVILRAALARGRHAARKRG